MTTGLSKFGAETSPLELDLPVCVGSVAAARHATERYAERHGIHGQRVALAVSEAMTNAVVHGSRDPSRDESVHVSARLNGDALVVSVVDEGPGVNPHLRRDQLGLGLMLMSWEADSMKIESATGFGTRVVMRFR